MNRSNHRRSNHRPSMCRLLFPIMLVIVLLLFIWVGRVAVGFMRLQNDLRAVQGASEIATLLMPSNTSDIETLVTQGLQDVRDLRAAIGPAVYALPALGWLPHYGGDLQNAPALLDFAEQALSGAQDTLAIGHALNVEMDSGRASNTPVGSSLLRVAESQRATIQRARNAIDEISRIRSRIDSTRVSTSVQDVVNRFDRLFPLWQVALDLLVDAPRFLGGERPRSYLLIAQNSDELRATGGFISGVALVRVDQGEISVVEFQDSFAIDDFSKPHPTPPDPLWRYMYAGQWVFRDANWSPDFPTSARQLEAIYKIDRNMDVDGVIAINQQVMPDLLDAVGAVTVEMYNERVDASNVISKIHEYWALPQSPGQSSDWWEHRKDFLGKLMQAMLQRLTTGELDRTKLGRAVLSAIETKNLLVYINDLPSISQPGLPLGGSIYNGSDDLLMLVDSNVGFNKVDSSVSRELTYDVTMEPSGSLDASAVVTYKNLSPKIEPYCVHLPNYQFTYADLQQGCYWNYVRLLVPAGSELIRTMGILDVKVESAKDYTVFAGYFVLPHGETQAIRFDYRLPNLRAGSRYTLILQKQSGAPTILARVRLHLPEGMSVNASPRPEQIQGNLAQFELNWKADERIQVTLEKSLPLEIIGAICVAIAIALAVIGLILNRHSVQE